MNQNHITEGFFQPSLSKKFFHTFLLGSLIALMCSVSKETQALANPASVNCIEKGGSSTIEHRNGAYGVCLFPDGKQCAEWAMFWGDCPVGGVAIADSLTSEERVCLIAGGLILDKGTQCLLATGKICSLKDYYLGKCHRNVPS